MKWLSGNEIKQMSFCEHLEELRWVLIKLLVILILGTGAGLFLAPAFYRALQLPLHSLRAEVELVFSGPLDAFLIRLKLGLLAGIILGLPFMLLVVWQFIAPGLHVRERRVAWLAVLLGTLFFCLGGGFGYLVLFQGLPTLVRMGVSGPGVRHLWSLRSYMDFCFRFILAFGAVFELPVVTVALARLGLVSAADLRRFRPYAIVGAFILAAILTPPDPYTQIMLGLPLVILYEASILMIRLLERGSKGELVDGRSEMN